jgi:uncharacterized protein YcbK (DUF882 family)
MSQLTANFRLAEFASRGHIPTDPVVLANIAKLAQNLQVLRDALGAPITIISGWRSQAHNDAVNGAKKSQHMLGLAADIIVQGKTPAEVFAVASRLQREGKIDKGGLHAYSGSYPFTHYDCRGVNARW